MTKAAITAINAWVPDYVLTNNELEKIVDTNDEWITTRTGIKERRILKDPNLAASYLGAKAVEGLCEKRQISPEEIDVIVCATTTSDMLFPSTGALIAHKTGAKNAFAFDISAACSGFIYALTIGANYIESGRYKKVVVVGTEKMSAITDYTDRATCIIFGDAAGAVLLEPNTEGFGIQDYIMKTDGSGSQYLHMKAGGSLKPASMETVAAREHYIYQEGQSVFKFAVSNMSEASLEVIKRNGLTTNDINWLVPHQANKRILDMTAKRIGIPEERVMINIHKYGNTTSATIPLAIYEWQEKLKKGDKLILTAFGGGFTWGALYLTWAY